MRGCGSVNQTITDFVYFCIGELANDWFNNMVETYLLENQVMTNFIQSQDLSFVWDNKSINEQVIMFSKFVQWGYCFD